MKLIRILVFPFFMCIYFILMNAMALKAGYLFLKYGGEFLVYIKDDKPSISKIYENLKKNEND